MKIQILISVANVAGGAMLSAKESDKLSDAPPPSAVARYVVCKLPAKDPPWHALPREDGEYIMALLPTLPQWRAAVPAGALHGRIPANRFEVEAITKAGKRFYVTFAGDNVIWVDSSSFEVPAHKMAEINKRVSRALNPK